MNTQTEIFDLAQSLGHALEVKQWLLVTAESCTGGGIAQAVTAVAGSSQWFDRGFVTYTNQSKREMLGVSGPTLESYGAVSEPVVKEMTEGALKFSHAQVAISVSGIAGPSGGTVQKPVGTVCFGWGVKGQALHTQTLCFDGDRESVRSQAIIFALQQLLTLVQPKL